MGRKLMALVGIIAVAAMGSVGSTDNVITAFVQQFYASEHIPFLPYVTLPPSPTIFLLIDEDSIDNGSPPNFFSDVDVNDQIAGLGLRDELPYFAANVSETIELHTGQVGDEGWFAVMTIPDSWGDAGPTDDGLHNFLGINNIVGPGLGTGTDPEALLDKIPDVVPLGYAALEVLEGETICGLVYDGDISVNYEPANGSLKGATLGIVGFQVVSMEPLSESSPTLPKATITILDANQVCGGPLALFTEAAELHDSYEVPADLDGTGQNATEFEDAGQNATQETGPVSTNSTETHDEELGDSAEEGREDESAASDIQEADVTEDTPKEQQSNDNEANDQGGSENESGDEEHGTEDTGEEQQSNDNEANDQGGSEDASQGQ
jgi:hypothetical protein